MADFYKCSLIFVNFGQKSLRAGLETTAASVCSAVTMLFGHKLSTYSDGTGSRPLCSLE
jgi:hypothetical protein